MREGFKYITGDIVIIQDADLEYNPQDYYKLIKPITDGDADVVYGSRFLSSETRRVLFFWHMIGNKFLTLFTNMVCNLTLSDMETCYKAFRSGLVKNMTIEENRFGFEPELTIKLNQMNCRIYEIGVSYYGRNYYLGKKIKWIDGFVAIWCIIKYGILRNIINKEPFLEKFLRSLRVKKVLPFIGSGLTVCDVGCGHNFALLRFIRDFAYKCIGIDKKVESVSYANVEILSMKLDGSLPLPDSSVDVVTMLAALEHFENDKKIIGESLRILRNSGRLLITVPSKRAKWLIDFLAFGLHMLNCEEVKDHERYYTPELLKKILTEQGFKKIIIKPFQLGFNIFCCATKE